ncbi:MAG: hypothetical protein Tsb0015_12900 [Simkaniaceae bacterium]
MKKFGFIFFIAIGLFGCQFFHAQKSLSTKLLEEYKKNFPLNSLEIFDFKQKACEYFEKELNSWLAIPQDHRTFENTFHKFHDLGETLVDKGIVLQNLSIISQDNKLAVDGKKSFFQMMFEILSSFKAKPDVLPILISFAFDHLTDETLSSFEWLEIYKVLTSVNTNLLPENWKEKWQQIITYLEKEKSLAPFQYLESGIQSRPVSDKLSMLTLNTCCLPYLQSLLFGGIRPWQDRMDSLVDIIRTANAEILCLQELFDQNASRQLYEKLKDDYKYFYINIDPKFFGFSPKCFGLGSGLFVASKVPLKNPRYEPFKNRSSFINRGYFLFTVEEESGRFGINIINTHLDAYNDEKVKNVRSAQLAQIIGSFPNKRNTYPLLVCGDLNIPFGTKEPAEDLLNTHFLSAYTKNIQKVTISNRTYCDFTDFWWNPKKFIVVPQILDYILLFHQNGEKKSDFLKFFSSSIVKTNNVKYPEKAISDHQGIFSIISLKELSKNYFSQEL